MVLEVWGSTPSGCWVNAVVSGELPMLHLVGWCSYDQHQNKVEGMIQSQGSEVARGRDGVAQEETGKRVQGCRGHASAVCLELVYSQVYRHTCTSIVHMCMYTYVCLFIYADI